MTMMTMDCRSGAHRSLSHNQPLHQQIMEHHMQHQQQSQQQRQYHDIAMEPISIDEQQQQQQQQQQRSFRWPAHLAKSMADRIHTQVTETLAGSRLDCRMDAIRLVQRRDICHVDRVLGSGAFSKVTAVTTRDGGQYACKHLQEKLLEQPDNFRVAAAELACEAHMLASFDHPNILKIRGWTYNGIASFEEGRHDSFFLLLDRLEETLEQRIARWGMEEQRLMQCQVPPSLQAPSTDRTTLAGLWRQVTSFSAPASSFPQVNDQQVAVSIQYQSIYMDKLRVMSEVASAMDYLHNQGVIFRDLKPANIGFLPCGKVQVFDFGLSRELPALDTSVPFEMSGKVGTLRYMAPEVALHQDYNVSADVYSWAMVTYEVLTCEKPFNGWTREMHADLVCTRGMRPEMCNRSMLDCPNTNDMAMLLQSAWCGNPHQRPTMGELSARLTYLQDQQLLVIEEQQFQQHLAELQAQEEFQKQQQQQEHLRMQQQQQQQQQQYQFQMEQEALAAAAAQYIEIPVPPPKRSMRRSNSLDSIGTIETSSLSADSVDFFF